MEQLFEKELQNLEKIVHSNFNNAAVRLADFRSYLSDVYLFGIDFYFKNYQALPKAVFGLGLGFAQSKGCLPRIVRRPFGLYKQVIIGPKYTSSEFEKELSEYIINGKPQTQYTTEIQELLERYHLPTQIQIRQMSIDVFRRALEFIITLPASMEINAQWKIHPGRAMNINPSQIVKDFKEILHKYSREEYVPVMCGQ